MSSYRSHFVVLALGGSLLLLAGMMLSADGLRRQEAPPAPQEPEAAFPTETAFDAESGLAELRRALEDAPAEGPSALARADEILGGLLARVRPADWPRIADELSRPGAPTGYDGMVLLLAGATRADDAVDAILGQAGRRPATALRALRLHGSPRALLGLRRMFDENRDPRFRAAVVGALADMPREGARAFAESLLAREGDPRLLVDLLGVLPRLDGPGLAAAVEARARDWSRAGPEAPRLVAAAFAALGRLQGGAARLLDIAVGDADLALAQWAAEALGEVREPALVPRALGVVTAEGRHHRACLALVAGSARPEHAVDLRAARRALEGRPAAAVLDGILAGMP